jgi:hypothetical protein
LTTTLVNQATGRCLDDSNAYGLRAYPCNGGVYQRLQFISNHDALFMRATGRCVDDSFSYGLRSYPCNSSQYQVWLPF